MAKRVRRSIRRKKSVARRRRSIVRRRIPRGIPLKKMVVMRYTGSFRLTPGQGTLDKHFFSMNSIHDPDRTGTGHQPYSHDQWAALYNHYYVVRSSIRIAATSTTDTPCIVGIANNDDTTDGYDFDTCIEGPQNRYKVLGDRSTVGRLAAGYNHRRNHPQNRTGLGADFGYNPTEETFWMVFARHLNVSATGSTIDCIVTAEYTVLMSERKELGAS